MEWRVSQYAIGKGGVYSSTSGMTSYGLLVWPFCYSLLEWPSGLLCGPSVIAFWNGLLVCPSGTSFCYDLLVWPSGISSIMTFWYGLLEWSAGISFCYDLLVWPSGVVFWNILYYDLLVWPSGVVCWNILLL